MSQNSNLLLSSSHSSTSVEDVVLRASFTTVIYQKLMFVTKYTQTKHNVFKIY